MIYQLTAAKDVTGTPSGLQGQFRLGTAADETEALSGN